MPWRLLVRNLAGHPVRTFLTLGSLVVAIFLICFLRGVLAAMESGVAGAASNRLMVQSAVSLFVDLPLSYQGKIETVPGIEQVMKMQWFGGYYQEPSNFFAQFAIDHERFLTAYPEVRLVEGSEEAWDAQRTGCLIGKGLAKEFGWRVGSRIPLIGTIFARHDGQPWTLDVVGIYESTSGNVDNRTLWFRYDYLDETLVAGAAQGPRGVGVFATRLAPGADAAQVGARIDALFENGPQRVQSPTEAEFQRQFVSMIGSLPTFLGSIGGGVLFASLLAVLNTMLMAARERTHDFGILKALGFTDGVMFALLIGETLLLCLLGGVLGVALALLSEGLIVSLLSTLLPTYHVTGGTVGLALGIAAAIGVLAGAVPAWQASRLGCVEALGAEV